MTTCQDLEKLRLHYMAANFDDFLAEAERDALAPRQLLERLVTLELLEQQRRTTQWRVRESRLGSFKPMAEFDWSWPKEIDRQNIDDLLTATFIEEARNVILAGPQGTGKTMIAKNIGWQTMMTGKSVLFTTASSLVLDLGSQESPAALQRRLRIYERPKLLIIDEIGYLSFDCKAADLLFAIINRRYEKGSIVLTTNLAFKNWHSIFPGSACLTALIDRLTHHAEILKVVAESFRHKEASTKRRTQKTSKTTLSKEY